MKVKDKRTAAPWLALLAVLQIVISGGILLTVAFVSTGAVSIAACGLSPVVAPRAPGHASYLDLPALLTSVGATCAEASAPAEAVDLIAPFAQAALQRRAERAAADPTYMQRIDPVLNQGRINFLLFGYGETYEPPYAPDFKGSINIFSLDIRTLDVSSVTLNHDIRAPEVERYRQQTDRKQGPTRIDQSYPVGGFDIMRLAAEDATGLAIDYQLAINDGVIKDAVDELFG